MKVWLLGSGSGGNAIVLQHAGTNILVDAGFGPRTLCGRLRQCRIHPESIAALVLTHEHIDHARGAGRLARRFGWPVYATRGTHSELASLKRCRRVVIQSGAAFDVDDFTLEPWRTPHDAVESIAVFATARDTGERAAVVHDLGVVPAALSVALTTVDVLILESNHDEGMLRAGPYPPVLQDRIAGPRGHLSNRAAGHVIRDAVARGAGHVVLAHLSEQNNAPELALGTVRAALAGACFRGTLVAAPQDRVCGPISP
ncbi:MAG: MBL fold metallo-hydrolase [Gemmatimonadaceae bacterium]